MTESTSTLCDNCKSAFCKVTTSSASCRSALLVGLISTLVSGVGLDGLHRQAYTGGRCFQIEQDGHYPTLALGHGPGAKRHESDRIHGVSLTRRRAAIYVHEGRS